MPDPAWARGLPLPWLEELAALFAAHDGDLPMGAFARMRENSLAAAAADGKLIARRCPESGDLLAAVVAHTARAARPVKDFTGQARARISAGDAVVARMAADPAKGAQALRSLLSELRSGSPALWVTCWQEHPLDRALMADAELGPVAVKIRASSELLGVYSSRAPSADERISRADVPAVAELTDGPQLAEPAARLAALADELDLADHYSSYNKRHTWRAAALRSFGGDPLFIEKPAEMSKAWKAEHPELLDAACEDTPLMATDLGRAARPFLDWIGGPCERVRIMALEPGGELTRHADITDPDAGTAPGKLARLHFPLTTNPEVRFTNWSLTGGSALTHMAEGECWYLDTRKPHAARNDSQARRLHLVCDAVCDEALAARIAAARPVIAPSPELAELTPGPLGSPELTP